MDAHVRVVRLRVPIGDSELASDALWQAGASAVYERAVGSGSVELEADADPTTLPPQYPCEIVDLDDWHVWLDAWRPYAEPVRAGCALVIQPPWLPTPADVAADDLVVLVDPGRAFGSGTHPATQLCLAAVEELAGPGTSVLDVGSGSGVLAVTAALLGAAPVVAVDVDPEAVRATNENARRNGVGSIVDAAPTPVDRLHGDYDLVLANVGEGVLGELAPDLRRLTAAGGVLLAGGLLTETWDTAITPLLDHRFDVGQVVDAEGWTAVFLRPTA